MNNTTNKLNWEHCYIVAGHGKRFSVETEEKAKEIKIAYCLETITKLW